MQNTEKLEFQQQQMHLYGHYNSVYDMLVNFALVLEDILKYEMELEKCKIRLWQIENFSIKQLFQHLVEQVPTKPRYLLPQIIKNFIEQQKYNINIEELDNMLKHFTRDQTDLKIFYDDFVQIFTPLSLEGRKLFNRVLVENIHQMDEQMLNIATRVLKMQINIQNGQDYHNKNLWKNLADFRTIYKYIDIKDKGVIIAQDLKEFMEKNCSKLKEFDTQFNVNDVELLIAKYDRIGNRYIRSIDLIHGFLPQNVQDARYN